MGGGRGGVRLVGVRGGGQHHDPPLGGVLADFEITIFHGWVWGGVRQVGVRGGGQHHDPPLGGVIYDRSHGP